MFIRVPSFGLEAAGEVLSSLCEQRTNGAFSNLEHAADFFACQILEVEQSNDLALAGGESSHLSPEGVVLYGRRLEGRGAGGELQLGDSLGFDPAKAGYRQIYSHAPHSCSWGGHNSHRAPIAVGTENGFLGEVLCGPFVTRKRIDERDDSVITLAAERVELAQYLRRRRLFFWHRLPGGMCRDHTLRTQDVSGSLRRNREISELLFRRAF
jgi:hypothetical protein